MKPRSSDAPARPGRPEDGPSGRRCTVPIERPRTFRPALIRQTARAFGLVLPQPLRVRADAVIE